MRVGQNPQKKVQGVAKPERITVAVLNYIPFVGGFYAQMPDVLRVCLNSLRENTEMPFDLLVFDNGSCEEVVQYLVDERNRGNIQYLMLSEQNLGKGGAWNVMLDGAPGEIIAYTDNDCYFYPNWLSESVQLLETFPNVGMVTARPFWGREEHNSATIQWALSNPEAELIYGKFLDWETYSSFVMSLGVEEEQVREWYEHHEDIRINYAGLIAQVGASHYQFLCTKKIIQSFLPFDMEKPMGQVRQLDIRMNDAGYLRLMTTQALMQNMSNTLSGEFVNTIHNSNASHKKMKKHSTLWQLPILKKTLMYIYDRIFSIYYSNL